MWQTGAVRPGHSNDDAATSNYNRHSIPRAAFHGLTGARTSRDYEITSQQSWRTWLHSVYFLHRNFSQPSTIDYRAHTVIVSDFVFPLITFATCWVESGRYLYRIVWRRTICTRCLSASLFLQFAMFEHKAIYHANSTLSTSTLLSRILVRTTVHTAGMECTRTQINNSYNNKWSK